MRFCPSLAAVTTYLGVYRLAGAGDVQQPGSPRRIGVLLAALSPESKEAQAFRQGLLDVGYAEGRDVIIEWRTANGDYARLPEFAADLVQRKVDVIVVQRYRRRPSGQARHLRHPYRDGRSSPIQSGPVWSQTLRILAETSRGSQL